MKKSEVAGLLAAASAYDHRRVAEAHVEAWHGLLADVAKDDAFEAMRRHFASSDRYLMPVHIIEGAAAIRQERAWTPPELTAAERTICAAAGIPAEEFVERRDDADWVAHLKSKWLGIEP
ncbi:MULTISPECIES: hypothetical protein [unclassified Leucobacter]|uniref:hypothetical protein n=1 Tax=unclassified Leucobacter TaxID=2621730 RepID=UPI00069B32EE|nr:hypothetical protein [Leucobacter sp. Ag1]